VAVVLPPLSRRDGIGRAKHDLDLLAALSHQTDFAIGCYCEDASHCHRTLLKELLERRGAAIRPAG
jgi:uncharacterized protein YeaO (DUF488 family)